MPPVKNSATKAEIGTDGKVFIPEAKPVQKSIVLTPKEQAALSEFLDKNVPGFYARPLVQFLQACPTQDYTA